MFQNKVILRKKNGEKETEGEKREGEREWKKEEQPFAANGPTAVFDIFSLAISTFGETAGKTAKPALFYC